MTMMQADMDELMIVSRLFPRMTWSSSPTRHVVIAKEGNVLRLYRMSLLLWLDECCAESFIEQLNCRNVSE